MRRFDEQESETWIEEALLDALDLPGEASEVLTDSKYWAESFFQAYLDKSDDLLFEEPAAGLKMAKVAPHLAHKIELRRCSREALLVGAYAVLGSALRACGDLEQADFVYDAAVRISEVAEIVVRAHFAAIHCVDFSHFLFDKRVTRLALHRFSAC